MLSKSSPTSDFRVPLNAAFLFIKCIAQNGEYSTSEAPRLQLKKQRVSVYIVKCRLEIDVAYKQRTFLSFVFLEDGVEDKQVIGGARALFEAILPGIIKGECFFTETNSVVENIVKQFP